MSKPRKLPRPIFIVNLEKRTKKPWSVHERALAVQFYDQAAEREEERRLWDVAQEEERQARVEARLQKKAEKVQALEDYRAERLELRKAKKEAKLKWVHKFLSTLIEEDIGSLPDYEISILSRLFGTAARETRPAVFVGWESQDYHDSVLFAEIDGKKKPNPTEEHFYPMQFYGLFLLTHIKVCQSLTREQFDAYMEVFNQVAHVTKKENEALGCGDEAPQNPSKFTSPERAYREAGVIVNFTPIKRLEDVAPREVLEVFFGDRLEEVYKYKC